MTKHRRPAVSKGKVLTAKIVMLVGLLLIILGIAVVIDMRWDVFKNIIEKVSDFLIDQPCCLGAIISFMGVIVLIMGLWYYWLTKSPEIEPHTEKERPRKKKPKSE
jgi:uncharacterized membrane protein